jgi:hypothetical protein
MTVDAAFFVLISGQIENRVNALAASRLSSVAERITIREAPYRRRLRSALPGSRWLILRAELEGWYSVRNQGAHGEALAGDYNSAAILARAGELEALLATGKVNVFTEFFSNCRLRSRSISVSIGLSTHSHVPMAHGGYATT